ncbi:MAG: rod shape-determining protein MreC [Myxococcales bacterium]|nr:MAG: rod shape-determining protein MreC [Myxococcales bacterium]
MLAAAQGRLGGGNRERRVIAFFRKHVISFLAVAVATVCVASLYAPTGPTGPVGRLIAWAASPFQKATVYVFDGATSLWTSYVALIDAHEEADDLRTINSLLAQKLAELVPLEEENARLRRLLEFKTRVPNRYLPARIVATDILGQFHQVTINLGADDGARSGLPVVSDAGVIGRIVETYGWTSKVMLMIDPNSSIDAVVRRTGAQGIIQGTNARYDLACQFAFSLRTEEVKEGDVVVTSGLDQMFPPGLTLGRVTQVSKGDYGIFQEARVAPAVDFASLREVLVIAPGGAGGGAP